MYLAIDIGGTKTLVAIFNENGQIKESIKFPTPLTYPELLIELSSTVNKLKEPKFSFACAAIPAKLDRKAGMAVAFGNRDWENLPIQSDIAKLLACPVVIENDAKCAGLAEAQLVLNDYKKVLYVTISTGIGAGLIIDGKIDPATRDNEVGQLLLEYKDRLTDWEDFGSGQAFMKKFGRKVSDIDEADTAAWYYISRNIAIGLINLIAVYSPEAIILGGGVGTHLDKFRSRLDEELKIYESPILTIPPILKAQRPEEAVIYGCYELAKSVYGSR